MGQTLTNKANLPAPIVRAVSYTDRDTGNSDYSITELISPPRIVALKRKHGDEITEDAADRIWSLMGSAAHEVLRRAAPEDGITEKRFFVKLAGKIISGQVDYCAKTGKLSDFKFTSTYAVKDGVKVEWEQQLNCYRWLMAHNEIETPAELEIIAILRDWSKNEARRNADYPQQGVLVLPVPVWTMVDTHMFLLERISMHEEARLLLPECSESDMWAKPEKWAVKKKGGARALRLYESKEGATAHAATDGKLEVEHRPGERVRCSGYCAVSPFCSQHQSWLTSQSHDNAL
jgi:hypothetical protein